jgi:multiple sugar transport system substrate-binding protein
MKKFILLVTILCFVATVLFVGTGCNNTESATTVSKETSTAIEENAALNVLLMSQSGYTEEDINKITAEFTTKYPKIAVNLTFVAYESLHDKIVTSFASDQGFDVVLVDCVWPAEFASAGYLLDVTDRITDEMKKDVYPSVLQSGIFMDKYYAIPWLNDIPYFYYNAKILKDAGFDAPPKTWTELIAQSKEIKAKGLVEYPFIDAWPLTEELAVQYGIYLNAFGGDFLDKDLKPILDSKAVQALDFMINGIKDGYINPASIEMHYDDVRNVLGQGNAAFVMGWTYAFGMLNDAKESKVAGNIKVALIPGEKTVSTSMNGGMGLGISSKCKYPNAAWKYVEYLSSKDVQRRFSQNSLPIWMSLYDDPEVIKIQPDLVPVSKEQYNYVVNRPLTPWYSEYSKTLQLEIQNALAGSKTSQEAIDAINKKAEELGLKYGK